MSKKPIRTNDSGTKNRERGENKNKGNKPGTGNREPGSGRSRGNQSDNRPEEQISGNYRGSSGFRQLPTFHPPHDSAQRPGNFPSAAYGSDWRGRGYEGEARPHDNYSRNSPRHQPSGYNYYRGSRPQNTARQDDHYHSQYRDSEQSNRPPYRNSDRNRRDDYRRQELNNRSDRDRDPLLSSDERFPADRFRHNEDRMQQGHPPHFYDYYESFPSYGQGAPYNDHEWGEMDRRRDDAEHTRQHHWPEDRRRITMGPDDESYYEDNDYYDNHGRHRGRY